MRYVHFIFPEQHLALVEVYGAADAAGLRQAYTALVADPAWRSTYDVVWDGRYVTSLAVDLRDVKMLVAFASHGGEGAPSGRSVIVAPGEICYTTARMISARLKKEMGREIAVVEHPAQAFACLRRTIPDPAVRAHEGRAVPAAA